MHPRPAPAPPAAKMDASLVKALFEGGFMGIEIPEAHGGSGASFMASCLAIEELAKKDASVAVMADVQNTLVNNVFKKWGSTEVQEFAYPLLASRAVGCFCLSEPGSGSDAFALKTRAEKQGDSYVINGGKVWITNGGEAELFLIFANVDPSKGYKGITAFLATRDTPGLTVGKKEDKLGIRASSTAQLHFDNLRVPASRIVGKVGEGYKIAIGILNEGRVGIAAQMLGIAQGAFDIAVPYTFTRKQFGTAIGDFQALQQQQAQIATEIEAARALVYNAVRLKMAADEDPAADPSEFIRTAAMAKLYASQIAEKAASHAIEWMGGMGFVKESGVEKFYRDAKVRTPGGAGRAAVRCEGKGPASARFASLSHSTPTQPSHPRRWSDRRHLRGHQQHSAHDHRQDAQGHLRALSGPPRRPGGGGAREGAACDWQGCKGNASTETVQLTALASAASESRPRANVRYLALPAPSVPPPCSLT